MRDSTGCIIGKDGRICFEGQTNGARLHSGRAGPETRRRRKHRRQMGTRRSGYPAVSRTRVKVCKEKCKEKLDLVQFERLGPLSPAVQAQAASVASSLRVFLCRRDKILIQHLFRRGKKASRRHKNAGRVIAAAKSHPAQAALDLFKTIS